MKFRSTLANVHPIRNRIMGWFGRGSKISYTSAHEYGYGDRVGQLIILPYPKVEFEEVDFLFPGDRGCQGYGSSGK